MKLYCTKCKYKFERDALPNRCPYCSIDNSITQMGTAQDIIDEVVSDGEDIKQSRQERGV